MTQAVTSAPLMRSLTITAAASLVLGALTSFAQGVLPDALRSLSNSVSGWTIVTFVLVAALRPTWRTGALLGPLSFVCLVLGYTVAAELRGYAYNPAFWAVVGILGGPFIGAAAAACVGPDRRWAAVGSGLVAGVIAADGFYGLTVIAETTSPVYWTAVIVIALGLLAVVAWRRLGSARLVGLQVASAVLVLVATSALFMGYASR